jgi:hypothetical protein
MQAELLNFFYFMLMDEVLDGPAVSELRRAIVEVKQRW